MTTIAEERHNRTLTSVRLCVDSGSRSDQCTLKHGPAGCTTALYRYDSATLDDPADRAARHLVSHSDAIRCDIDQGAYDDSLVRFILGEAVRAGTVLIRLDVATEGPPS